jgi:ATP-binding cassette subfamily B protein
VAGSRGTEDGVTGDGPADGRTRPGGGPGEEEGAGNARESDDPRTAARLGAADSARYLVEAVRLCWVAAPAALLAKAFLAIVSGVGVWATALLTREIVDRLAGTGPQRSGWDVTVLAVGLGLFGLIVATEAIATRYLDGILERALRMEVTARLYTAVNRLLGISRLEEPHFQDRIQLATNFGRRSPLECVNTALSIGRSVLALTGFVGSLVTIAPGMLVVLSLAGVPTVIVELALTRRRAALFLRLSQSERREIFYAVLLSRLEAAKEIRLFGLGDFFHGRLMGELTHINGEQHEVDRRAFTWQSLLAVLGALVSAAGLVWVIGLAARGQLTPGDVTLFIAAVAGTQSSLGALVTQYALLRQALLLFDHYERVVTEPCDLPVPASPAPCPALRGGIEFRDVWFRYADGQPWILRGITLTIPAHGSAALVGLNGAGKSTLVKLLCRFYDPTSGSIHWDGTDLRDLDVTTLRARVGVVFQDFMCYDLTAAENIGVGDVARMDDGEAIERAARLAGCHDTVAALPRGYDTLLSRLFFKESGDPEAGMMLSGGQWQRVAVARALLRARRDLLIMDEPSSGLDAEAEHELHTCLRSLRQGRTSVLISHRLSTVRDVDVIVVLESGTVVESGSHRQLMAAGGRYATLFELQARGYQDVDAAPLAVAGDTGR